MGFICFFDNEIWITKYGHSNACYLTTFPDLKTPSVMVWLSDCLQPWNKTEIILRVEITDYRRCLGLHYMLQKNNEYCCHINETTSKVIN